MLIKEFATTYNISHDTIRYYEKEKLLTPNRLENGFRYYDDACERAIVFILVLKQLGFQLQEIRMLLQLEEQPVSSTCNHTTLELFDEKIVRLEEKVTFFTTATDTLKAIYQLMMDESYANNKSQIESLMTNMYERTIAKEKR